MLRLCIADDEKEVREGLAELIDWSGNGIKLVGTASDGNMALEMIRRERPDITLLDIQMPRKNGLQIIEQIHICYFFIFKL